MASIPYQRRFRMRRAFTLVEMLAVIVVIGLLATVGLGLFQNKGRARRAAVDAVAGMVDQARNTAIRTRRNVALVIAGPAQVPDLGGEALCRLGLFELEAPPDANGAVRGRLLERWRPLPMGIVAMGGQVDGVRNVLDDGFLVLRYESGGKEVETAVTGLVFTPRGGLGWPKGSDPVAIRLVEGAYIEGKPTRTRRDGGTDEIIRVGRVVARPWRTGS